MATYKGIKGVKTQSLATDRTASSATDGTVWYNTTTTALKYVGQGTGAWASGTAMNTGRDSQGGAGTRDACLQIAGRPPGTTTANVESYDGSTWTEIANVLQQRWLNAGAGTQTAALCISGSNPSSGDVLTNNEKYDGTSWSEDSDVNTARRSAGSAGTSSTAALLFAGRDDPAYYANTEKWDGSSWTEVSNVNTARAYVRGAGSQTNAVLVGGYTGTANSALFETWDGTSWTESTTANTARQGCAAASSSTNALFYAAGVNTEKWNGSTWTEVANLAASKNDPGVASCTDSNAAAICCGGAPSYQSSVEVWADPVYITKTVTVS